MNTPSPVETPGFAERLEWVLRNHFGGSQRKMARAVGTSQASLSRIINQVQKPGSKLLAAIASLPEVSDTWLYTGKGDPFVPSLQVPAIEELELPVARRLLPGPVEAHRDQFTDDRFPVARRFYRESRYWYEVQRGEPIVGEASQKVAVGDLLLMETDPSQRRYEQSLLGKLCVVRPTFLRKMEPRMPECLLAEVGWYPGNRQLAFYAFGIERYVARENPTAPSAKDDPDAIRRLDHTHELSIDDVLAVNVLLVRP